MISRYSTRITFTVFIFIFSLVTINAQIADGTEASLDGKLSFDDEQILFSSSLNSNVFYIDLELLDGALSDLKIINVEEELLLQASLDDIPSDAFYELDLKDWEKGNYILQIRTYKEEIKKDIIIE